MSGCHFSASLRYLGQKEREKGLVDLHNTSNDVYLRLLDLLLRGTLLHLEHFVVVDGHLRLRV